MNPFRIACPWQSNTVSLLLGVRGGPQRRSLLQLSNRLISTSPVGRIDSRTLENPKQHNEDGEQSREELIEQAKDRQQRTPWHREGANVPPVRRQRSAGAMVKGKLLTTPSRLLKLVIPLVTTDTNADRKTVEPLALVVHPQQPLSYLERLVQSELPAIKNEKGQEKIPAVYFKAESSSNDEMGSKGQKADEETDQDESMDETRIDGKVERTGVVSRPKSKDKSAEAPQSKTSKDASAEEHGGQNFVRWSSSTEIGDFIRDAARGKEFVIEIEGLQSEIRIGVPSFDERTFYLRSRLRRASKKIAEMVTVKKECDHEAHSAAQRVALLGFAAMIAWWVGVYYLTFKTDLGWDTMEPVTYLVGLSAIMGGYLWFLYHNREVSYRAAMNLTISRRQSQLYAARGFSVDRWQELVQEANSLRSEIKAIASEYDVEWVESKDEHDEKVTKALKEEREKKKKNKDDDDDKDDDKDDEVRGKEAEEKADKEEKNPPKKEGKKGDD